MARDRTLCATGRLVPLVGDGVPVEEQTGSGKGPTNRGVDSPPRGLLVACVECRTSKKPPIGGFLRLGWGLWGSGRPRVYAPVALRNVWSDQVASLARSRCDLEITVILS